jgi:hypothetical protein
MILKATVSEGWVPSDWFGDSEANRVRRKYAVLENRKGEQFKILSALLF